MCCANLLFHIHLYENATHIPVVLQATVIFMHYSKALFIGHFSILRANQTFISSTGALQSGSAILYYILDAHLFLQPQLVPHREHTLSEL